MEKNRSTKELLQLALDFGDRNFLKDGMPGLCYLSREMKYKVITYSEYCDLSEFIHNNRPQKNSPHYCKSKSHSDYWWPVSMWAPRRRWLIDQIKNM